ncbi:hypothetical protein [uncultured Halomonas sp.]|uniref:hypothetical protein n=1 Tax=uncultured Halomonas sp. TaxID=173971 RepID=UPI00260193F7|nr:hypothetical protein [uncultured Halomonas sp.]
MRQDQLPSPGEYVNSQRLRVEAAKAISHAEIVNDLHGGATDSTLQLKAFFQACADAIDDTLPTP